MVGRCGRQQADPSCGERGSFLVGYAGRIFAIADDYSVVHFPHPFAAIGHGRHVAYGALHALQTSSLSLEEKCQAALEAAETYDNTVRRPFAFLTSP